MAGQGERLAPQERAFLAAAAPQSAPATAIPVPDKAIVRRRARRLRLPPGPSPAALARWRRLAATAFETEAARGAGFLLAPVLFCVGAVVYFSLPSEPAATAIAGGLALSAVAARLSAGRPAFPLLVAALLAFVGMGAAKLETWRAGTRMIGGEITTRLTGRIVQIEHRPNGRVRLTLDVLATERPTLRYQPDRVRITARGIPEDARAGSTVVGVARLLPPLGPLRPGSYDFAFESYFDGIGANGFFYRDPVLAAGEPQHPATRFSAVVENARLRLADSIRGHIGGAEGEIAAALVTGVRAGIPEEANETLRVTGLAHVLSISGLHMALVAGVVIATLRACFALFPDFASRRPVRKYAAVAALVALSLYLFLSGAAVAAQRSYLMIAVMLVALLFDRAALTMRNLAISALVILAVSPHEAAGPSFQMSFAATAALIAAYGWWSERRAHANAPAVAHRSVVRRTLRTVLLYAVGLAATSIIAGAATGIFGAWHFQRVAPLGLVANLATMPVVSVLVMPFAVLGTALMPFDLDGPMFAVMGLGLRWMLDVAGWLAERSPFDVVGEIPIVAVALLALALVPLTVATTTAVRLLAAPLLIAGVALIAQRDLPQVFVSEDGRLMGVRTAGAMAVNSSRPRAFTAEDWQRAMMAASLERPEAAATVEALLERFRPAVAPAGAAVQEDRPAESGVSAGFVCAADLCLASVAGGSVVAHAASMPAALPACGIAALIVIADATAANPCPFTETVVVTTRQLALRGSASVTFDGGLPVVRHAIGDDSRPWHDHRRFSREARGMPPWQPRKRDDPPEGKKDATATPDRSAASSNPGGEETDAE